MIKIKTYFNKYKTLIIFLFSFLLIITLCLGFKSDTKENEDLSLNTKADSKEKSIDTIKVDMKGFILNPGVYELSADSRVIDAINAAGGLIDGANTEYLNLSKNLTDEMVIIIYSQEQVDKYKESNEKTKYIPYECECVDNINDACINKLDVVNTSDTNIKESTSISKLISINKGTKDELMSLNGIGESKAQSIIDYRNVNGEFKSIEDLINVSGIGESVYSKIKDYITL